MTPRALIKMLSDGDGILTCWASKPSIYCLNKRAQTHHLAQSAAASCPRPLRPHPHPPIVATASSTSFPSASTCGDWTAGGHGPRRRQPSRLLCTPSAASSRLKPAIRMESAMAAEQTIVIAQVRFIRLCHGVSSTIFASSTPQISATESCPTAQGTNLLYGSAVREVGHVVAGAAAP